MTSHPTYKKKLIEVAIPLEAINAASAREKSIRHGHPSTLHLWWARRPLAACRAVLFAQLVDDPSAYVDAMMADPKLRAQTEAELPGAAGGLGEEQGFSAQGAAANAHPSRRWRMWRSRSSASGSSPSSTTW
jgi:putative DNA methylase